MKKTFCPLTLLITTTITATNIATATATTLPASTTCLISPVAPTAPQLITNIYGCRLHPNNKVWRLHNGADFRARDAAPLVAARDGVAQRLSSVTGGQEIRILGEDKSVLRYLHLSRQLVESGARVKEGQLIARSGSSGNVTAEHLHFEVVKSNRNGTSSVKVDPESLLCKKIEHKPGAELSENKPIYPPVNGVCNGKPNSLPLPQSLSQTLLSSLPSPLFSSRSFNAIFASQSFGDLAASDKAHITESPAPTIEQFDDVSSIEVLASEVLKRFANPNWHAKQAKRTIVPLLIEYLHMQALESFLNLHKRQVRQRIEALLAIRLARQNHQVGQALLEQQRESAGRAASG